MMLCARRHGPAAIDDRAAAASNSYDTFDRLISARFRDSDAALLTLPANALFVSEFYIDALSYAPFQAILTHDNYLIAAFIIFALYRR